MGVCLATAMRECESTIYHLCSLDQVRDLEDSKTAKKSNKSRINVRCIILNGKLDWILECFKRLLSYHTLLIGRAALVMRTWETALGGHKFQV